MKKFIKLNLYISLLIAPVALMANNDDVRHYPYVHIENTTDFYIKGTVGYASAFCSDDNFYITPNSSWTADSRGVCLVTKITATNQNTGETGTSYESSGTAYSQFLIYKDTNGKPSVTRKVN
ncbi:hypothetical protein AQ14_889 [Francisella tularensis subsp. novicida D9876]|uniref:hypothetical protein n=1 Tax=Francisella tularensis TaxID=263 RepID=UPI0002E0F2DB|nr:hypothetical protein [Francisella tularensis]AJI73372.1 hypothetical protein AQ14_889 [Francisella tularensis subsp. novicida D9876]